MITSNVMKAERHSRTRAWLMAIGALPLLFTGTFGLGDEASSMTPILRHLVWALMLLLWLAILATGGWLGLRRNIRQLMNDEVFLANRARALQTGFWAAMALGIGLYFVGPSWDLSAREALRILLGCAVAASLLHFAWLERR